MTKYLVTGATGQLGQLVLNALSEKKILNSDIAVLVRRADAAAELKSKGYDVRMGDYSDADKLAAAFAGIERLLLISGSEVGERLPQHINVIAGAKEAGVEAGGRYEFVGARHCEIHFREQARSSIAHGGSPVHRVHPVASDARAPAQG